MAEEDPNHGSEGPGAVPLAVGARSRDLSPASDVTRTPSRRPGDVTRIDGMLLSDLADSNSSPVQRLSPLEEEDMLEAQAYADVKHRICYTMVILPL